RQRALDRLRDVGLDRDRLDRVTVPPRGGAVQNDARFARDPNPERHGIDYRPAAPVARGKGVEIGGERDPAPGTDHGTAAGRNILRREGGQARTETNDRLSFTDRGTGHRD